METTKIAVCVSEMAQLLSISRPMAYQLLNREDFPNSFRVGNKRLISVSALEKWVEKQTESAS